MTAPSRITAVLGPTNTGKTHYAIERMLAHRSGVIGLPLRLLAREVYERMMNARGLHETLFLGAETMRPAIAANVPGVQFMRRERFSELSYTGSKKLSRMPGRAAIVGFSVENVYAIAELLRRQKGGAAVVMGALSPRTRNAQVEMYQSGEVDYLVATDAIGMGLNLDIDHVAFSALNKFDGRRMRELAPEELAQIAGRAGRHMNDGTFGVTGEAPPLDDGVIEAITGHSFRPVKKLHWRNSRLEFGSVRHLIGSLEKRTDDPWLSRMREADDLGALKALAEDAEVQARTGDVKSVRLLWDVCRIPDFRGISHAEHARLLTQIFGYLHQKGQVPDDWMAQQLARIDRTDGDIDTLSKRLAYIRTWTYVAQRRGWMHDEIRWREETRAVEDRLSDALHGALTQRFVDRRTSVLLRRLKQKEAMVAEVSDKGDVTVEGQFVGRMEGFRFRQDKTGASDEDKTVRLASIQALKPQFHLMADRFYNAPDPEIDFTEQGGLMWGQNAVGKLTRGNDPLRPLAQAFVEEEAGTEVIEKVTSRLQHFIDRKVAKDFEPLIKLRDDEALAGQAKGFAYRMVENFGIIPRSDVAQDVKTLDQDARGALRKHGIRFGQFTIFQQFLLKPAPTRLRLVLWSLWQGLDTFPEAPPPGLVTVPSIEGVEPAVYAMSGYRAAGDRAIRIDMLERLADMIRDKDSRGGFEASADMLSITGMTLEQFANLMAGLGYHSERGERPKARPAAKAEGDPPVPETPDAPETPAETPDEAPPEPPQEAPVESPDETPPAAPEELPAESPDMPDDAPTMATEAELAAEPEAELEVFYTFTWGGLRRDRGPRREGGGNRKGQRNQQGSGEGQARGEGQGQGRREGQGQGQGRGEGRGEGQGRGGPRKKGKGPNKPHKGDQEPKEYRAAPPKREKKIDPDNPFAAALSGFKTK